VEKELTHSNKTVNRLLASILAAGLLFGGINTVVASSDEAVAEEMTTLFRAARAVISANQANINDASKGDKGLSGDFVTAKAKENFHKATGHKLDDSTDAAKTMLAAIHSTMNQAQPLINEKGKGFKGFLPAIFAKQVADTFTKKMNGNMRIKLTAPKKYVRNRANRPDKWENSIINGKFMNASYENGKPFSEVAKHKGKDAYRYILPEYYKQSCLNCHGGPKGEKDITGGKKEGGKLGELGGAISFTIYK